MKLYFSRNYTVNIPTSITIMSIDNTLVGYDNNIHHYISITGPIGTILDLVAEVKGKGLLQAMHFDRKVTNDVVDISALYYREWVHKSAEIFGYFDTSLNTPPGQIFKACEEFHAKHPECRINYLYRDFAWGIAGKIDCSFSGKYVGWCADRPMFFRPMFDEHEESEMFLDELVAKMLETNPNVCECRLRAFVEKNFSRLASKRAKEECDRFTLGLFDHLYPRRFRTQFNGPLNRHAV